MHPRDSVLGTLAKSTDIGGVITLIKGLNTTYSAMIQAAFQPQYWNNTTQMVTYAPDGTATISPRPPGQLTTNQFTQMEANFSLFFGLAVQLYEATLIAGESPFDLFLEGAGNLTGPAAARPGDLPGGGLRRVPCAPESPLRPPNQSSMAPPWLDFLPFSAARWGPLN